MKIFDTHCHLQTAVLTDTIMEISEAENSEVVKLLNNSVSFSDWKDVLEISENYKAVLPALGIHPCYIDMKVKSIESELAQWDFSKCRAIGEIGLDKIKSKVPIETQIEVFELFLNLSRELNIPCSVHCISAFDELIFCLKKFKNHPPIIIHSFSGSMELARSLSKFGCFFSVGKNLNQQPNIKQLDMLKYIFPSLMMLETDSPGKITTDGHIIRPCLIADYLNRASQLLNILPEEIADKTYKLSIEIFRE